MSRVFILSICILSLALPGATFAKGPNDKAFEHADDNASFNKGKKEKKQKKEKKEKKEKKSK